MVGQTELSTQAYMHDDILIYELRTHQLEGYYTCIYNYIYIYILYIHVFCMTAIGMTWWITQFKVIILYLPYLCGMVCSYQYYYNVYM